MVNLNLSRTRDQVPKTFAKIDIFHKDYLIEEFNENVHVNLYQWKPRTDLPFEDYDEI